MMRRLYISVTPPVPSPTSPASAFVCWKCGCAANRMSGWRPLSSMAEQFCQARVPPLRHRRGELNGGFFFAVVVNVEVLGLEHLEIELLVHHLVAAEVLRVGGRRRRHEQHGDDEDPRKRGLHEPLRKGGNH
jgi:hypothetical protein